VEVRAELAAVVLRIRALPGQRVAQGEELVTLESMKMEIPVLAPRPAEVAQVHVAPGQFVQEGDLLVTLA
jgi:acetyl-CoA carboxylase biotin carboxyl carrier protein